MQVYHEEQPHQQQAGVISGQTLIPLSILGGCIVSLVSLVWWLSNKFDTIDHRLERIEMRMVDQLSRSEHEAWALRLARDNPQLKVPDIR